MPAAVSLRRSHDNAARQSATPSRNAGAVPPAAPRFDDQVRRALQLAEASIRATCNCCGRRVIADAIRGLLEGKDVAELLHLLEKEQTLSAARHQAEATERSLERDLIDLEGRIQNAATAAAGREQQCPARKRRAGLVPIRLAGSKGWQP